MAWTFEATRAGYGKLWREAVIRLEDYAETTAAANKIIANEQRYKQIQAVTGVPWFWIGAIHNRENSNSFAGHLHNGDPLTGYTTHVPANRPQIGHGPPFTWEESAIDVLQWKNLDDVKDWVVERMLLEAELYNGLGYALYKKINSPYVWAATTLQQRGKYMADGQYDANHWDTQLGVAAILKRLAEMRPDIAAALASGQPSGPIVLPEVLPPLITRPGTDNLLPVILSLFMAMLQQQQKSSAPGQQQPDIFAMLGPLLQQLMGGQPLPLQPPVIEQPRPPVTPPTTPVLERPSVLVGGAGFLAGLIAQLNGNVAPPIGETATLPGILTTILPIATMFFGGPLGGLLSGLLGRLGPVLTNMSNKS